MAGIFNPMADSTSESQFQSDALGLRLISGSFFNIHGFFVGFGSGGSSDSESIRSPTSPLDVSVFSNLSNPFSHKLPRSPIQNGHEKKRDCTKVGLGIVNLLLDETKSTGAVLSSPKRKNIIFGSQVKTGLDSDAGFGNGDPLEAKSFQNSSPISLSPKSSLSSKKFCEDNQTTSTSSLSLLSDEGKQMNTSLGIRSTSLPVPISTIGSLSAREIELSEDYTFIISYGPNPKTTHIFGDCILECHSNELPNFDKIENPGPQLPQEADCSDLYPCDEFLSICYLCKKKFEKGDDIYMNRGEIAFFSFDCRSEEIFAEDEMRKAYANSPKSSSVSSYHEDLFLTGMPIGM